MNELDKDEDIRMAFTVFTDTALFPVRKDATTDSSNTNSTNTAVGSQVVSASIFGIPGGAKLSAPVRISLRLINSPVLGTNETISSRLCVFWDYNAAGETTLLTDN